MSEKPIIEDKRSPDYKSLFATSVFGGLTPDDPKIIFFRDEVVLETDKEQNYGVLKISKIIREALIEIHMTPTQFKRIALWMTQNVAWYENNFGLIPTELIERKPRIVMPETSNP